jgi:hypothetical protein
MNERNLFNEMLTSYPPEKRELAREIFHRFADGDSGNFFTQLFLVLDVYAHYAQHIPAAVIEANHNSFATLQDMREEIETLAKAIEQRDLNISNHAEKTDELCKMTIAKCNETVSQIELMLKNLPAQMDTKGVVDRLEEGVKNLFLPLHVRTNEIVHTISPLVEKMNKSVERASKLWPQRIWQTALIAGLIVGLSIAALGIGFAYWKLKQHYNAALATQIISEAKTLTQNQKTFAALGVLNIPLHVAPATDSLGHPLSNSYCLYIEDAQDADMESTNGRIFFGSTRSADEIQQLLETAQARQGYILMDNGQ